MIFTASTFVGSIYLDPFISLVNFNIYIIPFIVFATCFYTYGLSTTTTPTHNFKFLYISISSIFSILTSCIAFHSYKGGTGKTTITADLATYSKKGISCIFIRS